MRMFGQDSDLRGQVNRPSGDNSKAVHEIPYLVLEAHIFEAPDDIEGRLDNGTLRYGWSILGERERRVTRLWTRS